METPFDAVTSYGETLMRKHLKFIYKKTPLIYNHRPDWLKNEATGKNLELDVYIPSLKRAYEFNGEYHFNDINARTNDRIKKRICREKNILLIVLTPQKLITSARKKGDHKTLRESVLYVKNSEKTYKKATSLRFLKEKHPDLILNRHSDEVVCYNIDTPHKFKVIKASQEMRPRKRRNQHGTPWK